MCVIGSLGYEGIIKYIQKVFNVVSDYYIFGLQFFFVVLGIVFESCLIIDDKLFFIVYFMSLMFLIKNKELVDGNLVFVLNEGCNEEDYFEVVLGNIVFIKCGVCFFGIKLEFVGKVGVIVVVVYNYEDVFVGGIFGILFKNYVVIFGLFGREVCFYVERFEMGKMIVVIVYIDVVVNQIVINNIIV